MFADAQPVSVSEPVWVKSSYSGGNTTECVEAALGPSGVLLRDSKRPEGPRVPVSAGAWCAFLAGSAGTGRDNGGWLADETGVPIGAGFADLLEQER